MPVVVGVDSSTSACKVKVRDLDTGNLLDSGRAPHPPTTPPRSEQDPRAWEEAFAAACEQAGVPGKHRPVAISVAAQQHGLVTLDAQGDVVRPAKLWNDTESAPDADWLIGRLEGGPAAWAAACGSVPVAAFTITKLSWLHRSEPDAFERVASVLLPHDWLTWRLTGRRTTDRGDASGTGYWSPTEGGYRFDLLAIVDKEKDWDQAVPTVLDPFEAAGEWAACGAAVAPGTGDNMAAALGLGVGPGDLVLSIGTSGTAFAVSEHPTADPTGAVAGFADATGRFLPLVCTLNGTKVTDAFSRLLAGGDAGRFDQLALAGAPGAGGVVLVPHLDGERTPNRPGATGTLGGLRSDVRPEQVARAAVEGVVCNLLEGVDALMAAGVDVSGRVFLVGGGARSAAYRHVVAALLGRPVLVPRDEELVARGAALQAAAVANAATADDVAAAWPDECDVLEPDATVDAEAVRQAYAAARVNP